MHRGTIVLTVIDAVAMMMTAHCGHFRQAMVLGAARRLDSGSDPLQGEGSHYQPKQQSLESAKHVDSVAPDKRGKNERVSKA
jgi:hypothetical protein